MEIITDTTIAFIGQKGIPKEFPGTSGVETYVERLAEKLIGQNKTVICYIRKWASTYPGNTYNRMRLVVLPTINTKPMDTISYSLLASVHASFSSTSLIWYQGAGPAFFSFIPKLFGKHVYTTLHTLDWNRRKWGFFARIFLRISERIMVLCSDKLFVGTSSLKNYYKHSYHKDTVLDKYPIIPKGSPSGNLIYKKYHLKKNSYVLFMGRFVPEKRVEWLIRASTHIPIPVVLMGGSSHTFGYTKNLHRLAQKKNILFTGYVFGEEKEQLLARCRLFVLPSSLEGYPLAVNEALGYHKPCLVGDFLQGEYPENNPLIHYFRTGSFNSFVHKLRQLIST
jgi:glycosyltransferase involved in cell wall biosynthesis